ncbi:MAG: hypothetical protein P1U74_07735 [Legionellaceae bacterium]|nr:hypothetical protein [Legionellaceae bacterium]
MHAKRVQSLANSALGLLQAKELILHKIGAGLAQAMGLNKKHTRKQVDRLLSDEGVGFYKKLKVNTVKTRTHSLLNQGIFYYKYVNDFKPDEQEKILTAFNELLADPGKDHQNLLNNIDL